MAEHYHEVVLCHYLGFIRDVHLEACQWHRQEADKECEGCSSWKHPVRREG